MVKLNTVSLALVCAVLGGCAATPAPLFGARGLDDFDLVTTPSAAMDAVVTLGAGGIVALTGNPPGYLATRASYTNYRLHAEWRWSGKPGNGGALLHIQGGPKDRVWPLSQQVQTKIHSAGDLLPMAGAGFAEPLTSAPGAAVPVKGHVAPDSERAAGEWNSMDVLCRDGTIEVSINGVMQNRVSGAAPASGRIGFQLEGAPYELRNVTVQALD
jgi:hypothetical protein